VYFKYFPNSIGFVYECRKVSDASGILHTKVFKMPSRILKVVTRLHSPYLDIVNKECICILFKIKINNNNLTSECHY
jgi:hypothetical protein